MRLWVNGRLVDDPEQPVLSASDHGLTVGDGVFETIKVVEGSPFALTRHLDRLAVSAAGIGLPRPDLAEVRSGVDAVLQGGNTGPAKLRITYTGGPSPLGSDRGTAGPTAVVALVAADPPAASTAIVTVPWPRNERGALAGLKTTSYAENVVALAYAKERGGTEAVCANTAGLLCEGTGSNVFYVLDGELVTPTLESGCLAGVSRALVLGWYGGTERDTPIDVLARAEEIFLTSTTRDVQPVHSCDGRELAAPGPVTAEVQEAWAAHESKDFDP